MNEGNQLLTLINRLRAAFIGRDEGIFLPFAGYAATGGVGLTANDYMMMASMSLIPTLISWTQTVQVATTNNGSNYWTVSLDDGSTTFASFNTSAIAANTWSKFDVTSFTQPSVTPPYKWIGISCAKTGTPGRLFWTNALLRGLC